MWNFYFQSVIYFYCSLDSRGIIVLMCVIFMYKVTSLHSHQCDCAPQYTQVYPRSSTTVLKSSLAQFQCFGQHSLLPKKAVCEVTSHERAQGPILSGASPTCVVCDLCVLGIEHRLHMQGKCATIELFIQLCE